ncbi:hypothetical protein GCM10007301_15750 [Azorhizobium oxalatiphilum]|uniref:Uncharacterized protein n=1 Tax=Azorhizobium oxalatiphilum TaxID=980631 RepID=A0A917BU44_9HYPH|nr:hypothetical protein [Azorhizobium oxalatiphilum]GGF56891.1 hypothetical protein GCM10007301_15750 [Azorhizobium oxalatiphilum]
MGTQRVGLTDVHQGKPASRKRILAPLRYLVIYHPEKWKYDVVAPIVLAATLWAFYVVASPKIAFFGESGLLKFSRDILVMAVPFLVGALATVAMASSMGSLDKRARGAELYLDGKVLTLRQFVCYLLGYLSFVGIFALVMNIGAEIGRPWLSSVLAEHQTLRLSALLLGPAAFFMVMSAFLTTILWALYFLTDIVNREPPDIP